MSWLTIYIIFIGTLAADTDVGNKDGDTYSETTNEFSVVSFSAFEVSFTDTIIETQTVTETVTKTLDRPGCNYDCYRHRYGGQLGLGTSPQSTRKISATAALRSSTSQMTSLTTTADFREYSELSPYLPISGSAVFSSMLPEFSPTSSLAMPSTAPVRLVVSETSGCTTNLEGLVDSSTFNGDGTTRISTASALGNRGGSSATPISSKSGITSDKGSGSENLHIPSTKPTDTDWLSDEPENQEKREITSYSDSSSTWGSDIDSTMARSHSIVDISDSQPLSTSSARLQLIFGSWSTTDISDLTAWLELTSNTQMSDSSEPSTKYYSESTSLTPVVEASSVAEATEDAVSSSTRLWSLVCHSVLVVENAQTLDIVSEIVQSLTINNNNISATIRKKTSAMDARPSATTMGALGIGLLAGVFGTIILIDLTSLKRHIDSLRLRE